MSQNRPRRVWSAWLALAGVFALAVIGYTSTFVVSYDELFRASDPLTVTDVARLSPARVTSIEPIRSVEDIRAAIQDAAQSTPSSGNASTTRASSSRACFTSTIERLFRDRRDSD